MIEYITYDVFIIVLLKLNFLKKFKSLNNFRFYFLLTLLTIVVFILNSRSVLTSDKFFGIDTINPILRQLFFMLFLGIKTTIYGFFISDYFRTQSNDKTPISGEKGIRGRRGEPGIKAKECDDRKCNINICETRILDYVSEIYSEILINKGKKGSKHYQIANNFLKNKINLLCESPQLEKYRDKKSPTEVLNYIKNTWKKWIQIIMQYKKGEYFMETDYLTDNDFDNLIQDEDKMYHPKFDNKGMGTPSKGKDSPFDEIKKYDMWYWGEPANAKIKVIYRCDLDDGTPTLKLLNSNQYTNLWRSSIAVQNKVDGTYIPYQSKGDKNISVYRPKMIETDEGLFKPLGDVVIEGDINEHTKTNIDAIVPKNNMNPNYPVNIPGDPTDQTLLISGDIKSPDGFENIYKSQRKTGIGQGVNGYSFWKPKPPDGYVCLGNMIDNNYSIYEPDTNHFACVPKQCTRQKKTKTKIKTKLWTNSNNNEDLDHIEGKLNNIYNDEKHYLFFESDGENDRELIPEGEEGSCINNLGERIANDSKWKTKEKNSKKYSIHSYFENTEEEEDD
jgi:hypothetical protein